MSRARDLSELPQGDGDVTVDGDLITNGNVGIGTSSPDSKLHISGTGEVIKLQGAKPYMQFADAANNNKGYLESNANGINLGAEDGNPIRFIAAGERMRIDNAGNVGIGTSSPSALLHVNGSIRSTQLLGTGVQTLVYQLYSGNNSSDTDTVIRMALDSTGGSGSSQFYNFRIIGYGQIGTVTPSFDYVINIHTRWVTSMSVDILKLTSSSKRLGFFRKNSATNDMNFYIAMKENYSYIQIYGIPEQRDRFRPITGSMFSEVSKGNPNFASTLGLTQVGARTITTGTENY